MNERTHENSYHEEPGSAIDTAASYFNFMGDTAAQSITANWSSLGALVAAYPGFISLEKTLEIFAGSYRFKRHAVFILSNTWRLILT